MVRKLQFHSLRLSIILTIGIIMLFSLLLVSSHSQTIPAQNTFWPVQSIDTMKFSRDEANNPDITSKIPGIIKAVAQTNATHVAIATPYNEEFIPVLTKWVNEARKNHLHVWFRGNFSEWEGWFNHAKFTDISQHHVMTRNFILMHPDLFQDGDIFTPVPEAENGGLGDPRESADKAATFNQFLIDSYANCTRSFAEIAKGVTCGYFSMNGDIAKDVLTQNTVDKIGNVIVIDHYVDTPQKMIDAIDYLTNKFHAKIVLGEFGAPIPDINGDMNEDQQAAFIDSLMQIFYAKRDVISGVNYWVIQGGTTALLNDDGTQRKALGVITNYFSPNLIHLTVKNTTGEQIANVISTSKEATEVQKYANGSAVFATPYTHATITIIAENYHPTSRLIWFDHGKDVTEEVILEPDNPSILYRIRQFFFQIWNKFTVHI